MHHFARPIARQFRFVEGFVAHGMMVSWVFNRISAAHLIQHTKRQMAPLGPFKGRERVKRPLDKALPNYYVPKFRTLHSLDNPPNENQKDLISVCSSKHNFRSWTEPQCSRNRVGNFLPPRSALKAEQNPPSPTVSPKKGPHIAPRGNNCQSLETSLWYLLNPLCTVECVNTRPSEGQ